MSIWSAAAWIGSFGLGVTIFLVLAGKLEFEYRSLLDIVAVPAFRLYPEWRDWWLYLLALAGADVVIRSIELIQTDELGLGD